MATAQQQQQQKQPTKAKGKPQGAYLTKSQLSLLWIQMLGTILFVPFAHFFGSGDETKCIGGGTCFKPGEDWIQFYAFGLVLWSMMCAISIKPDKE